MKSIKKWQAAVGGVMLSAVLLVGSAGATFAAPNVNSKKAQTPPETRVESGPQAEAPVEPGSKDAEETEKLGPTNEVKANANGKLEAAAGGVEALAGNVAGVDFQGPYNYCYKNLVYTPVKNTTTTTKYIQVKVYNQGSSRDIYTSVAPGATAYPASYGVEGSYSAYLYVWNGSSYQYDEYKSGNNTCKVDVTRTYNTGGWVQLKIQNTGTAYASQKSTELAPYPASGTYTGTHYDYPAAGGAAIYRWFYVGSQPYGIVSETVSSTNSPYYFTGDL